MLERWLRRFTARINSLNPIKALSLDGPDIPPLMDTPRNFFFPEHFVLTIAKFFQIKKLLPGVFGAAITSFSPFDRCYIGKWQQSCRLWRNENSKALDAKSFISSSFKEEITKAANKFDLVLDTIPFDYDHNQYVPPAKSFRYL